MYNTTNSSNLTSPTYGYHFNEEKRFASIIMYFITLVVGFIGNILVFVIVAGRRTKRTENDIFIANLALSDLFLLLFSLPLKLYAFLTRDFRVPFAAYCTLIYPMTTLTFSTSIFTMTAMAVHRCRRIINPFMAPSRKICSYIWIMFIWVLSITLILPLMILIKHDPKLQLCTNPFPNKEIEGKIYTGTLFVLQCIIPLSIISGAYFLIWRDLSKSRTYRASVNKRGQIVANSNSRENKQVIKTIAIIVILFVICTFPTQIAWMAMDFGSMKAEETAIAIFKFSDILAMFNSCLNPIVYGSLTRHFRYGYYRYLCFVCLKCKRKINRGSSRAKNDDRFTRCSVATRDATSLGLLDTLTESGNLVRTSATEKIPESTMDTVSI